MLGKCSSWPSTGYDDGFHKFALEWDFFKLVWYIDGNPVRTAYRYTNLSGQYIDCNSVSMESAVMMAKFWPQTDNMGVIFNLAVQNDGNEPDASTTFPKEFEIEYFRFYRKGNCSSHSITTEEGWSWDYLVNSVRYSTMLSQNITISGAISPVVLDSTQQLDAVVSNTIILDPGFEVENGANFTAFIDPGYCDINAGMMINHNNKRLAELFLNENKQGENTLSMYELLDLDVLNIYPNPSSDHIMIGLTLPGSSMNLIEISDSQGRLLLSDTRDLTNEMKLDVSAFSLGTYFVKVLNRETGKVYLERFTKSN
ncbi:Glycosyl hydrolases family 16 [compost metagenome]